MPISIGIPFYNCERFLPDAIRSVFAQTYQDWELILIDDGSTDRSLEIAKSIDDPRVRVISDGKNLRQAARRNQANELAKYDIIAVMDADDMMFPQRLESQYSKFANTEVQIVASATCVIDDNNNILSVRNDRGQIDVTPFGIVKHKYRLIQPTLLVKRQWYLENQYDPDILYADDFELFFRASVKKTLTNSIVKVIDTPLLFYREDGMLTLKKIRMSQSDVRKGFTKHGVAGLGLWGNFVFRTIWEMRAYIYLCAGYLGLLRTVKKLRGHLVKNSVTLQYYQTQLQTVLQTRVPGMDEYLKQKFNMNDKSEIIKISNEQLKNIAKNNEYRKVS